MPTLPQPYTELSTGSTIIYITARLAVMGWGPFARDGANKLVRRSYWLDMDDRTLVMVMVNGIGRNLTNDEKRVAAGAPTSNGAFRARRNRSTLLL
jgi:hypothetical protein